MTQQQIQQIQLILRQAGEIMVGAKKPPVTQKEGHGNFVTQTDVDVQNYLIARLTEAVPQAQFLAEEQENAVLTDDLTFIIDPIDGTTNFMHQRNCSCISVGLLKDQQPMLAFVYQPWQRDMFFAKKGEGAYLNEQPIHVSDYPMEQAVVNYGTAPYYEALRRRSVELSGIFLENAADVRRCGSAALDLCDVAAGRAEMFWELLLCPWDLAAGQLLVTEAGGMVTDVEGKPLRQGVKTSILASNGLCHQAALKLF